jgi:hypothetical protein
MFAPNAIGVHYWLFSFFKFAPNAFLPCSFLVFLFFTRSQCFWCSLCCFSLVIHGVLLPCSFLVFMVFALSVSSSLLALIAPNALGHSSSLFTLGAFSVHSSCSNSLFTFGCSFSLLALGVPNAHP